MMQEVDYFSMKTVAEANFDGYTLVIPKIGVTEHLNNESLTKGVLMDNASKEPSKGKVILFGHRTLLGSPFLSINELKNGDSVEIDSSKMGKVNYIVNDSYIVKPDYEINIENQTNTLYMVTCDPIGSLANRLIIEASFTNTISLDSKSNENPYQNHMLLLGILSYFIVGTVISRFYIVKADRKFIFITIFIISIILIGLYIHPIFLDYFSFLANLNIGQIICGVYFGS
jgi:LPXTG-site transpeptidase (sortase) family protein